MAMKWIKTTFKGVRYREHSTRKHGVRPDRYFSIRYKLNGKDKEEGLGWGSDGWTAEKAALELTKLRNNQQSGEGAFTMAEKKEAELARKEREAQEKALAEKAAVPFSGVWIEYIAQCKLDGKKSCDREESLYNHWIAPVIGTKPLAEIAPIHLEKIKSNMAKGELSPRSIHYCLAVVRQAFNYAVRHSYFGGDNPTKKVKKPTVDNRRMRFLSHDEANQILDGIRERSMDSWRITLISLHTGLRFSEIARLVWSDIDVEKGLLWARDGKNNRCRFGYLTEEVKIALLDMEPRGRNDLIFPDKNGGQRRQMSDTFDRVVDALGLNEGIRDDRQKVCFHTCRHSFASWLVEGGEDLIVVKELMGHKSLAMTERYSHLSPKTLQRASRSLYKRLTEAIANGVDGRSNKVVPLLTQG